MNENEKFHLFLACVCVCEAREKIKLNGKNDKSLYVKRLVVDEGMTTSDSRQ